MPKDEKKPEANKIGFLQDAVDIYNGYKISKDGLSREEDVEVMKGIYEEQKGFYSGFPMVAEAITDMEETQNRKGRRRLKGL